MRSQPRADTIAARYGNLFDMYQRISGENPYEVPMRIYPAVHYTMGGLWVDYHLMSTIPGLFVLGEANFSDHGANRLGASALMQGLADGYFVIPYTLGDYLAQAVPGPVSTDDDAFGEAEASAKARHDQAAQHSGRKDGDGVPPELGRIRVGSRGHGPPSRGAGKCHHPNSRPAHRILAKPQTPGEANTLNKNLEFAGRVADFMDLAELMARDALQREESCGGHFREEYQTPDGEAQRDDEQLLPLWQRDGWEYDAG
jgi:succinate dehydrogenase / fumarate reductase, flavoprotein subunit